MTIRPLSNSPTRQRTHLGPAPSCRYFRKPLRVANKAGPAAFDPVTAADRAAERAIRKAVRARFPDHGIVGEEYGTVAAQGRYRWVIDPIDGTRAFIMGSPLWGTLIGLLDGSSPSSASWTSPSPASASGRMGAAATGEVSTAKPVA